MSTSNESRILAALRVARTDTEVALVTGIPAPSVRRTRLQLVAAGRVVRSGAHAWIQREAHEMPESYHGRQHLARFTA